MKLALLTFALFTLGSQAFACIDINDNKICRGDTVYPDSWDHSRGGVVKAINPHTQKMTVKSNNTGDTFRFRANEVSLALGCLENVCVGDKIYPDSWDHSRGGVVKAINPHTKKMTVKSNNTGDTFRFFEEEVSIGRGCIEGICVEDTVLPDSWNHTRGGVVKAVNPYTKKITVKSNNTGNTFRFTAYVLAVLDECLDYDNSQRYNYEF
ncbi:putative exported protein [Halobacteriovorax marinus SJ]|uniref:Exported protein n=1 Tax=Halobacteriovorax marinus (strain ATCC BAA-682 / DSM 15412 / SJ) TaxID=862908 RepID=E1X0E2_HALMS|nr:hypothetical protein [Halobacteriovorax marinus]CBW26370.1 putative exported protein [Halobacteriovorax marinus SJ]